MNTLGFLRPSLLAAALSVALAAQAAPVTYTVSGFASGRFLGGDGIFSSVVFTAVGDTSNLSTTPYGGVYNPGLSVSYVCGSHAGAFVEPATVEAYGGRVSFRAQGGPIEFDSPDYASIDLAHSFGPVAGTSFSPNPNYDFGAAFETTEGTLLITEFRSPSFQVQAVPEPASMAALGLGAAAMLRRRKKA